MVEITKVKDVKRHYMRLYALFLNLTESIHKFVPILLEHIAEDFKVDRLGLFLKMSEDSSDYTLRGIHGAKDHDKIGLACNLNFDFSMREIYLIPTPDIGWDAYVAIRDENQQIIAILAVDDTSSAKEFSNEQINVLMVIKNFLQVILQQHSLIEEFRFIDPLTGILNRRGLSWKSEELEAQVKRTHAEVTVAFIDLDQFKEVNTRNGETFGDLVLKAFVDAMKQKMRGDDIFARFGGEEFIIIWKEHATVLAQRLRQILESFATLQVTDENNHAEYGVPFSGGVVQLRRNETIAKAIERAVKLKKKAKKTRFTIICEEKEKESEK